MAIFQQIDELQRHEPDPQSLVSFLKRSQKILIIILRKIHWDLSHSDAMEQQNET